MGEVARAGLRERSNAPWLRGGLRRPAKPNERRGPSPLPGPLLQLLGIAWRRRSHCGGFGGCIASWRSRCVSEGLLGPSCRTTTSAPSPRLPWMASSMLLERSLPTSRASKRSQLASQPSATRLLVTSREPGGLASRPGQLTSGRSPPRSSEPRPRQLASMRRACEATGSLTGLLSTTSLSRLWRSGSSGPRGPTSLRAPSRWTGCHRLVT